MKVAEVLIELVEAVVPHLALLVDPVDGRVEAFGFEMTRSRLGFATTGDQSAVFEHLDVFRHGLECEIERLRQLVDRRLAGGKPLEDCSAGGVGERVERRVQFGFGERCHVCILLNG